ncbi:putative DnaG-like primase [uncultured Caudovirales phage]|uniref:Putative DnaG-like primase n=1 Tax=uncultured Caudovirales phage TaxID=2100421 RepID=A0A6J5SEY4_9CAUD|nr:putative DnaG-like primase [uncultured Caudovirales phage]CAB4183323.1 putative DnaG-like primase [uncultured Caudovirales phage]CAB4197741.1 putative DnaG-like primase [uncultured Caudovirales phage]CAB4212579.1 putative DnaG-like primase [uncultured Caudovirales phage]CAB5227199.1 putative DnaG-like primase [uncultured Caudovirales phage]
MRIPYRDIEPHIPPNVGDQVGVNHDLCPAGADTRGRLFIKRTDSAILAYCHNCGGHAARSTSAHSGVRQRQLLLSLARQADAGVVANGGVLLPYDAVDIDHPDFTKLAKSWLYQHHMSDALIRKYHICYSPALGRVILPVFDKDSNLIFWQGRAIDGAGPKYLNSPGVEKPIFTTHDTSIVTHTIVITEDILSAIRVAAANYNVCGMALLGTHDRDNLPSYFGRATSIMVWLDDDVAGRSASLPLVTKLKTICPCGITIWAPKSPLLQPKNLTNHEIQDRLTFTYYKKA